MDCHVLEKDLPYTPSERHLSCTTQSGPVRTTEQTDEDINMTTVSPQHMAAVECESSQPATEGRDQPHHTFAPSQQSEQSPSYPSPEPPAFYGSPIPSHGIGRSPRSPIWAASQSTPWTSDVLNYSFAPSEPPRGLALGSYSHGSGQNWEVSPGYQQFRHQDRGATYSHRYPSLSVASLSAYNQSQLGIPSTAQHPESFPYPNYAVTSAPMTQDPRRYGLDSCTSAPTHGPGLAVTTSFSTSSYPNLSPSDAGISTPMTPVSDMDEDLSCCYDDAQPSPAMGAKREEGEEPETPKAGETPYAQLIYQAFMSSPRRAMTLQEIYRWFLENTDKGKKSTMGGGTGKGWQNSIRHNLSMNGAFERRQIHPDEKEGEDCDSLTGTARKREAEWVLTEAAIKEGVQSTTRYRNTARRGQLKRDAPPRNKAKGAPTSRRRITRKHNTSRDMSHPYAMASSSRYEYTPPNPTVHYRYYGPHTQSFEVHAAHQLQQLSLAPAPRMMEPHDYEYQVPTSTMSSPMDVHHAQNGYPFAPLNYSPELFLPSVPGASTVTSEDDINEVLTPEANFTVIDEPTVCGGNDQHNSPHTVHAAPTTRPYNQAATDYYSNNQPFDGLPRYSMSDVSGVCGDSMIESCSWDGEESSQH